MLLHSSRSWSVEVDGALTLLKRWMVLLLSSRSWTVEVDGALTLLKILECRGGWCSYAPQDLGV